jgi:hypothetical protein
VCVPFAAAPAIDTQSLEEIDIVLRAVAGSAEASTAEDSSADESEPMHAAATSHNERLNAYRVRQSAAAALDEAVLGSDADDAAESLAQLARGLASLVIAPPFDAPNPVPCYTQGVTSPSVNFRFAVMSGRGADARLRYDGHR